MVARMPVEGETRRAFVNWFPCVFMRASQEQLLAAFPGWRLPLEHPIRRQVRSPFGGGELGERLDWDPGSAPDSPVLAPSRPPLPFVPFPTCCYWHEAYPALFTMVTGIDLEPGEDETSNAFDTMCVRHLVRPALYGGARLLDADLELYTVPASFRDGLARAEGGAADRWAAEWERVGHRNGREAVVGLAELAREALKEHQDLVIWSNT